MALFGCHVEKHSSSKISIANVETGWKADFGRVISCFRILQAASIDVHMTHFLCSLSPFCFISLQVKNDITRSVFYHTSQSLEHYFSFQHLLLVLLKRTQDSLNRAWVKTCRWLTMWPVQRRAWPWRSVAFRCPLRIRRNQICHLMSKGETGRKEVTSLLN